MNVAIVTGASSGVGQGVTNELLSAGWKVYGLSRRQPEFKNDNFIWIKCDLSVGEFIPEALNEVQETKIDLLISNAGVAFNEFATEVTSQSYEDIFSVNVLAPMLIMKALSGKLEQSLIISISSVSDRLVEKDFALYCASKAANTKYFEALADELVNAKIITLLPDYIDTPMLRNLVDGDEFDWDAAIKVEDFVQMIMETINGKIDVVSSSNIIVVTDGLLDDLKSREKLFGYNVDTKKLININKQLS